jgi:hypothetical protein
LLLSLRDISWLSERTNFWDALGVVSYGLVFAFVESLAIFCAFILLGFLVSRHWEENRRVAVLGILLFVLASWSIAGQLYFMWKVSFPSSWLGFFAANAHPVRMLYAAAFAFVLPTVMAPVFLILKLDKPTQYIMAGIDRISLLSAFYLFFDFIGLVIIVIRNIG